MVSEMMAVWFNNFETLQYIKFVSDITKTPTLIIHASRLSIVFFFP